MNKVMKLVSTTGWFAAVYLEGSCQVGARFVLPKLNIKSMNNSLLLVLFCKFDESFVFGF